MKLFSMLGLFKPKVKAKHPRRNVGLIDDKSPFAMREAYKTLYTNIVYMGLNDKCRKIAVTSAVPSEGKSTVSANLAYTISHNSKDKRILLIDADMRAPRIARMFGLNPKGHGLSEYLAGVDKEPSFIEIKDKNLTIMTSGTRPINPTQLLSSPRMKQLMDICEERFDYVIIDTLPVNVVADALLFSNYVNGYVLSVLADRSDVKGVKQCVEQLQQINAVVFGFVISGVKMKNGSGKYGYGYGRYSSRYSDKNYEDDD
ncbi:MAG: CpsD/CapB family tyrosine-protein kinase [Clostridia bacterium]|nr:CpsD/CapB family tyrosine-protein kinase [Clostridia bacterium]